VDPRLTEPLILWDVLALRLAIEAERAGPFVGKMELPLLILRPSPDDDDEDGGAGTDTSDLLLSILSWSTAVDWVGCAQPEQ